MAELGSSPYINRFIQPDSIIPNASDPQSWNRYSYVQNNPIRYTDPTGHLFEDGTGGVGGPCNVTDCSVIIGNVTKKKPKPRVYYLNGLGGRDNLEPEITDKDEYKTTMYYIQLAVGAENTTHIPVFLGYKLGLSHIDMFGEALGIGGPNNWTDAALSAITSELTSNPLEAGQQLILVGSSAGGTVAIELLDDLQAQGIYVDQVILRGSFVMETKLVNVGRVDYIAAENPYSDQYYSIDSNPFDGVNVQEHRVQGLNVHNPSGRGVMNQIGTLIYNLILGKP